MVNDTIERAAAAIAASEAAEAEASKAVEAAMPAVEAILEFKLEHDLAGVPAGLLETLDEAYPTVGRWARRLGLMLVGGGATGGALNLDGLRSMLAGLFGG